MGDKYTVLKVISDDYSFFAFNRVLIEQLKLVLDLSAYI